MNIEIDYYNCNSTLCKGIFSATCRSYLTSPQSFRGVFIRIMSQLALGLDLSTQQLKIIAVDVSNLETFYENSLTFEMDLSHYYTIKGVYNNHKEHEVFSPVEMWIEAVDVILQRMKDEKFPFERIVVISGAGQALHSNLQGLLRSNMLPCSGHKRRNQS